MLTRTVSFYNTSEGCALTANKVVMLTRTVSFYNTAKAKGWDEPSKLSCLPER